MTKNSCASGSATPERKRKADTMFAPDAECTHTTASQNMKTLPDCLRRAIGYNGKEESVWQSGKTSSADLKNKTARHFETMKTAHLFDIPTDRKSDRVKLTEFKRKHGIRTVRCCGLTRRDLPWVAILPQGDDVKKGTMQIMGESVRLYEESGYLATAEGELSAVRKLCQQLKITCDL